MEFPDNWWFHTKQNSPSLYCVPLCQDPQKVHQKIFLLLAYNVVQSLQHDQDIPVLNPELVSEAVASQQESYACTRAQRIRTSRPPIKVNIRLILIETRSPHYGSQLPLEMENYVFLEWHSNPSLCLTIPHIWSNKNNHIKYIRENWTIRA